MSKRKNGGLQFEPRGEEQVEFVRSMVENPLTVCRSRNYGNGKSYCAIGHAAQLLLRDEIQHVVFCRNNSAVSKRLGWSPGNRKDKLSESVRFAQNYFKLFLGEMYRYKEHTIEYRDVADLAGDTFLDTFMILDEAADCSFYDLTMFISRAGHGTKCVICGTDRQETEGGGFSLLFERLSRCPHVGLIELKKILRNSWVGDVLNLLDAE
jgi:phosphate starvation-inducible protein PhoH